jgi:hypothetical protein
MGRRFLFMLLLMLLLALVLQDALVLEPLPSATPLPPLASYGDLRGVKYGRKNAGAQVSEPQW